MIICNSTIILKNDVMKKVINWFKYSKSYINGTLQESLHLTAVQTPAKYVTGG